MTVREVCAGSPTYLSLITGVPMASILFPASTVGAIVLPLMTFHQIQLIVCAYLARVYERRAEEQAATAAQAQH